MLVRIGRLIGGALPQTPATTPAIEILDRSGNPIVDRAGAYVVTR